MPDNKDAITEAQARIQWLHSLGYTDRAIGEAVDTAHESITRIRNCKKGYTGRNILEKLRAIQIQGETFTYSPVHQDEQEKKKYSGPARSPVHQDEQEYDEDEYSILDISPTLLVSIGVLMALVILATLFLVVRSNNKNKGN